MPLRLEGSLTLTDRLCREPNLTSHFSEEDLQRLGEWVWEGYEADERSRAVWLRRSESGMDLAVQLQKEKNFPWPGAANVSFPLVTIAAIEFHSRAYPALIDGKPVKVSQPGPDPQGTAKAEAELIGDYMSYQVMEEDEGWEEGHDRGLLQEAIVGSVFAKTMRLEREDRNDTQMVSARDFVMNYYTKDVNQCQRKTHRIYLSRNDVWERVQGGVFCNFLDEPWYQQVHLPEHQPGTQDADKRTGMTEPEADELTPLLFLEQHVWVDLDKDGYAEPYIITVEATSHCVARITARWERPDCVERLNGKVLRIRATEYFTKYELLPSPDNGAYGIGFGIILGPLNEAVNSLVNQLLDSGTMANAAGGFLSRGVKIRGGVYSFAPFEWNRVDCSPEDLKNGIYPLPVRDPSQTLFSLLSYLVQYAQRIPGATETLAGENPGQNTKNGTMQEMVAQGMTIYQGIFKRQWRCMRQEFQKHFILNGLFIKPEGKQFGSATITRSMFLGNPSRIRPAADPHVSSETMRIQKANLIAERARAVPGYDIPACEKNLLSVLHVEGVEVLYPGPDKVPPLPNPKVQVEQLKLQSRQMELQQEQQQFILQLQEQQKVNSANIIKLMAQAEALAAQADSDKQGHTIALIDSMIAAEKLRQEQTQSRIDSMLKMIELSNEREQIEADKNQPASNGQR